MDQKKLFFFFRLILPFGNAQTRYFNKNSFCNESNTKKARTVLNRGLIKTKLYLLPLKKKKKKKKKNKKKKN